MRVKAKRREISRSDGNVTTEVEREIELRDTALEEHKDLMDRTDGRPVPLLDAAARGEITITVNVVPLGVPLARQIADAEVVVLPVGEPVPETPAVAAPECRI